MVTFTVGVVLKTVFMLLLLLLLPPVMSLRGGRELISWLSPVGIMILKEKEEKKESAQKNHLHGIRGKNMNPPAAGGGG